MTLQTLFTSWPSSSSGKCPGQSRIVAYLSMEIANQPCDSYLQSQAWRPGRRHSRAAADKGLRLLAVTLANRQGYFKQSWMT
jgi:hypothetical protein